MSAEVQPAARVTEVRNGSGPEIVGGRVREERLRQKIGVRELARRVGVSASLVSQVELGKASPSVGTLYAIVNELGLSLDELFFEHAPSRRQGRADAGVQASQSPAARASGADDNTPGDGPDRRPEAEPARPGRGAVEPVVRHGSGKMIQLATGVQWERLSPESPHDVDFLLVSYDAGSESCPADSLMRHSGREFGYVVCGRLGIAIGFETYELGRGDSISFDSTMPHRLFTVGDEQVQAIWFVVGRRGDTRIVRNH